MKISVILPCAGEGKRLGTPGPKELFEIYPGRCLIDFSLEHINAFITERGEKKVDDQVRIITVIRPGKESVFYHVRERLPDFEVDFVMFDDNYREWPGSVLSAKTHFSDFNIVLLPDSFIKFGPGDLFYSDDSGETLIGKAADTLKSGGVIFGVIPCSDPEKLSSLGAVRIVNNKVRQFTDKPSMDLNLYNGYWGVYGFRDMAAEQLYEFLIDSVEKRGEKEHLLRKIDPDIFYIDSYHDLGTVYSMEKFMRSREGLSVRNSG